MPECDFCGKEVPWSQIHESENPRPPYYDTMKICNECYSERSKKNVRNINRTGKREKKTYSQH